MLSRKALESRVSALLKQAGLDHVEYALPEFVGSVRRVYPNLVCEPFTPVGNLRAGVFRVGATLVVFYPDPEVVGFFAALYALSHEIAHIMLEHQLFSLGEGPSYSPVEESEAEQVARMVVRLRTLSDRTRSDDSGQMGDYFSLVSR